MWPSLYLNNNLFSFFNLEDYPEGTWLGDENNPEMRVRCPVSQADMLHISTNCRTPEKMALTLLDYLFHREVQAMSNLSGQGKHGKKQLDPLMIYGIRCEYSWTHTIHQLIFMRPAVARLLGAATTTTTTLTRLNYIENFWWSLCITHTWKTNIYKHKSPSFQVFYQVF